MDGLLLILLIGLFLALSLPGHQQDPKVVVEIHRSPNYGGLGCVALLLIGLAILLLASLVDRA